MKEIMTTINFTKLCDFSNSKTGKGQLAKCEEKLLSVHKIEIQMEIDETFFDAVTLN